MKSILITGAGGFVGRNLAEYLPGRGYKVHPFTHRELELSDESAVIQKLTDIDPEIIIHCATVGGSRKTGYDAGLTDIVSKNLRMFFNLARSLKPGTRLITMGSGAEYDKRRALSKIREENFDAYVPADGYGYAKYVISKYVEKTENITCLRIFGLYGKYEDYTFKFISNAIVKNLLGLPIVINQNVRFDYLWAGDFCRLVERFIGIKPEYRHYNITPTESIDLVSLAEIVNAAGKTKSAIKVLNPGLNREYTGGNARLLRELPGFKFTPYAAAVKELYDHYSANPRKLDLAAVKDDPYLKNCGTTTL
jgi:GDP-L-fucose synthase